MTDPAVTGQTAAFALAGVTVGLKCRCEEQLRSLVALWRQLFHLHRPSATGGVTLDFSAEAFEAPDTTEVVYRTETLRIATTAQGFFLHCGEARLSLNVASGRGAGTLPASFWRLDVYHQREFFLLSLLMLLRPHGRYGLHANGLVCGGRGLIVVGPSGSGKTTLMLSLLRDGWHYLSDDALMLEDAAVPRAFAFRRGVSFTSRTEKVFGTTDIRAMYCARDKRVLALERLYPGQFTPSAVPRLIVFPDLRPGPTSAFSRLEPAEALALLVQQSAGSMVDKALATRQLELLKRLVERAACYRLEAGTDILERGISSSLEGLLARG